MDGMQSGRSTGNERKGNEDENEEDIGEDKGMKGGVNESQRNRGRRLRGREQGWKGRQRKEMRCGVIREIMWCEDIIRKLCKH